MIANVETFDDWFVDSRVERRELVFDTRAVQLAAFHADAGRWPLATSSDSEEAFLGRWMALQRNAAKRSEFDGGLVAVRRERLNEIVPGWDYVPESRWDTRFRETTEFFATHGRLPEPASQELPERALGRWLQSQRASTGGELGTYSLTSKQYEQLDAALPGWNAAKELAWMQRAEALAAFRIRHGRWPSPNGGAKGESGLGRWHRSVRHIVRTRLYSGGVSLDRIQQLDALVPGWDKAKEEDWRARARAVAAFKNEHGRWPATRGSEAEGERPLAVWLSNQRKFLFAAGSTSLTSERRQFLDDVAPGWCPEELKNLHSVNRY